MAAAALAPFLTSCATDLSKFSGEPFPRSLNGLAFARRATPFSMPESPQPPRWSRVARRVRAVPAASLYTTADDYAQVISALLADTAVLQLTLAKPIAVDFELGCPATITFAGGACS